jgi:uncharacterized protein (DUF58 family)
MRWLHQSYMRGTRLNHFVASRLRPAGIGVCLLLILVSFMGIGQPRESVYVIFSFTMGITLIALPWAMFRRAHVRAERGIPRHATVGVPFHYNVRIINEGRRRLGLSWLAEVAPDPRPTCHEFLTHSEPGEHERNWFDRSLAYYRWQWLMLKRRAFDGGYSENPIEIGPAGELRCNIGFTPLRRGVIVLDNLRLLMPDPFGLFQSSHRIKSPPSTVMVLPKRHPLPPVELPGGAAFKIGSETSTNSIGTSGEFVGLREYRPGDPLRQIHWKSWARTGRPIVKELEDTCYPRYGLVLDTFIGGTADTAFEELVTVAASFASTIDTRESLLDLMFIKDRAHIVTAGRGVERTEKLLEVLAGVSMEETGDFESLTKLVLRHREDLTSCLVVLLGWDEKRSAFLKSLTRGGLACSAIIVGHGERPDHVQGHWLDAGNLARDLSRLPVRLQVFY